MPRPHPEPPGLLGARYRDNGQTRFLVWAPQHERVDVEILAPHPRRARMQPQDRGYFEVLLEGAPTGTNYRYILSGNIERPDPASRFQPDGVHGPSQVVDPRTFQWTDGGWKGLPLEQYIVYELHTGTFTPEGTFDAILPHLDELQDLGITAIELMPVAQFPENRNWGYDGVFPFAVQNGYGGPQSLARLVNACHERKVAVVLDVVYNHLGPEGNYLADFGPYFTDQYRTPWGKAINFDGAHSDEVVRFFVENALYWLADLHIDALRLDAIHGITDRNARPFLQILAESVKALVRQTGRKLSLIAESDLNDIRFIQPLEAGGYGLDAQWSDDFHHALHAFLTGERSGYYQDFGRLEQIAKAFREGYVYSGQYSNYRKRRHGNSSEKIPARQFVVFAQNHDQIGNRMLGERLSRLVSFEDLKLTAGAVLLSPFIPLIFMGEEYGETAPFNFFTTYEDSALIEAVRKGRREEFREFEWQGEPPDPQAESTFLACKLERSAGEEGKRRILFDFYRELIALRKGRRALSGSEKATMEVNLLDAEKAVFLRRWSGIDEAAVLLCFGGSVTGSLALPAGRWRKILDSSESRWLGPGSRIPEWLESSGRSTFEFPAKAVVVFARMPGEHE